jgi:hypothetical protein
MAAFTFAMLPDSLTKRLELLRDFLAIAPKGSEAATKTKIMIVHLENHLAEAAAAQREFDFVAQTSAREGKGGK